MPEIFTEAEQMERAVVTINPPPTPSRGLAYSYLRVPVSYDIASQVTGANTPGEFGALRFNSDRRIREMFFQDELLGEFGAEAGELLRDIEVQLACIQQTTGEIDVTTVGDVYRAVHTIKGAAGFLGMRKVSDLAGGLAAVLKRMRSGEMTPDAATIGVLVRAAGRLNGLINDIHHSNGADVAQYIAALDEVANRSADFAPMPA